MLPEKLLGDNPRVKLILFHILQLIMERWKEQ